MDSVIPIMILVGMVVAVFFQLIKTSSPAYQLNANRKWGEKIGGLTGVEPVYSDDMKKLIDLNPKDAIQRRQEEMTQVHDIVWNEWETKSRIHSVTGTAAAQFSYNSQFFGPLRIPFDGNEILVFDWLFRVKVGKGLYKNLFHTVATIVTQKMNVPDFYLRPQEHYTKYRLSRFKEMKTNTPLDLQFCIESLLPARTKTLFQSELAFKQLIPFLCQHDRSVEWTGDRLAIFSIGELVPAEEIKHLALEATELLLLLEQAPDAITEQFKLEHGLV